MCWCTIDASPCMPVADGGGIMPEPAVGKPFAGMVPLLFNILALVDCNNGPAESIELESDREVGGDRTSASLVSFAADGSA